MTGPAYVVLMVLAWVALLVYVVGIFHAQRWLDEVIEDELDSIAPAPFFDGHGK